MTGADVARQILNQSGIYDVSVQIPVSYTHLDVLIHTDQSNRNFSEHLKNVKNNHIKHRMDLELNAINDIGRRLLKNMSLSDLREYRKKIAEFLKMCISQGF